MDTASAAQGPSWAPWHVLRYWSPFKIDALGLVTLLGAEEINAVVGRLVSSAYLEYLPLLGAYVIAGDRFTEKAAGWNLYNISQGIHTTDLAAWLTRWMLSQEFETTRTYVEWKITPPRSRKGDIFVSILIGLICNGFLIVGTVLSADWYGFANALAMDISIIVRVYVIGQQRRAVDAMIDKAVTKIKKPPPTGTYEAQRYDYKAWKHEQYEQKHDGTRNRKGAGPAALVEVHSSSGGSSNSTNGQKQAVHQIQSDQHPQKPKPKEFIGEEWKGQTITVLIIQSDSKAVTFRMPNELVIPPSLFIEGPQILNPKTYFLVRSIGWFAFAVHIVAIGMADLPTQLYTVVLIVLPTLLIIKKTGCDDSDWMKTFSSWGDSIFRRRSHAATVGKAQGADDSGSAAQPRPVRSCWIGSRLKAEVYEWPESYEFQEVGEGENKTWVSGPPKKGQDRSKKRQDLYAWLALSSDEEESMDKWDLFPHIRNDNYTWWKTYKLKKHALIGKSFAGLPQHVAHPEPKKSGTQSSQDPAPKMFRKDNRTATRNFVDPPGGQSTAQSATNRQSSSGAAGSSAFPAISAHDQEVDNVNNAQPVEDSAANPVGGVGSAGVTRVDTQPTITAATSIDPAAGITQSPTVMNATEDQP